MEHGVNDTPDYAYTNSVYEQHSLYYGEQHTFEFYTKCVAAGC